VRMLWMSLRISGSHTSHRLKVAAAKITPWIVWTRLDAKWQVRFTEFYLNIELAISVYITKYDMLDHDMKCENYIVRLKTSHVQNLSP
jgi:hypothetical protein